MMWPLTSNCPQQLFAEPHPVDRCALFTYALTLSGLRQACPDRKKTEERNRHAAGDKRVNESREKKERWTGDEGRLRHGYFSLYTCRNTQTSIITRLQRFTEKTWLRILHRQSSTLENATKHEDLRPNHLWQVPLQNDTKWPNRYKSTAGAKNQTNYGSQMIFSDS